MTKELDTFGSWKKEMRLRVVGDAQTAARFVGLARSQAGFMERMRFLAGLPSSHLVKFYLDGKLKITTDSIGDRITAKIDVSGLPTSAQSSIETNLWVPSGFIVYPASDSAKSGWGTPVVQTTAKNATPYSAINLAPGLDVGRWTVGGALGQVLLTRDENAGYVDEGPDSITLPLLFDPNYGPKPSGGFEAPKQLPNWTAYRIEFVGFSAQSPAPSAAERASITANKKQLFEVTNAHRESIGRDPFLLTPRGWFDSAQITAEVMFTTQVMGHMYAGYPKHWRTADDVFMHDGAHRVTVIKDTTPGAPRGGIYGNSRSNNSTEMVVANSGGAFTPVGVDSNGVPVYQISPGGPAMTGQAAYDWLIGDGPHRAFLESADLDGFDTVGQTGIRGNVAATQYLKTEQWVGCGNRVWHSKYDDVPSISWFGFASLNLGWETWPCSYAPMTSGVCPPTDPLIPFATSNRMTNANEMFWFDYKYAAKTNGGEDVRTPALDNRIFSRGRCIAIAPGLVWAAAIQKFDSPDANKFNTYRLVALVHQESDQPNDKTWGATPYLHVWYCDLPSNTFLTASAPAIIRGIYGAEATAGEPWDEVNNPCSWRDGGTVDVGTTTGSARDMLKYASQWVFKDDGLRAVCLRDTGVYMDYLDQVWPLGYFGPRCLVYGDPPVIVLKGINPTAIELAFTGGTSGQYGVAKQWLGQCSTSSTPVTIDLETVYPGISGGFPGNNPNYHVYSEPLAAGYAKDGSLRFAKYVQALPQGSSFNLQDFFYGVSFGNYEAPWSSDFPGFVSVISGRGSEVAWTSQFQVLDVAESVMVAVGHRAFYAIIPWTGGVLIPAYTQWRTMNWYGTSELFNNVRVWRNGELIHDQRYAVPDGAVIDMEQVCYQYEAAGVGSAEVSYIGVVNKYSASANCLPSYATDKSGNWVISYVFFPQPNVGFYSPTPGCICAREESDPSLPETSCKPHISEIIPRTEDSCVSRGGWSTSSFADSSALAGLVGSIGTMPHLLYARSV